VSHNNKGLPPAPSIERACHANLLSSRSAVVGIATNKQCQLETVIVAVYRAKRDGDDAPNRGALLSVFNQKRQMASMSTGRRISSFLPSC
jgi:hypothetical protein